MYYKKLLHITYSLINSIKQELVNVFFREQVILGFVVLWSLSRPLTSAIVVKAAIDNKQMNECCCIPIKLYLQKQVAGRI